MDAVRGVLIAGTTSDAGKSFVATGLCRTLHRQGVRVQPFKAVNMSLNSVPAEDGGEIAMAQWLQCQAAGVPALTRANPILLKSEGPGRIEIIVRGVPRFRLRSWREEMGKVMPDLRRAVLGAAKEVRQEGNYVVAEGAGSPVEVNLRRFDLANLYTAKALDLGVLLVTDLERGGALAQIVGTLELLSSTERKRVRGILFNRMRGDRKLLIPAEKFIARETGIPVLGVLPYLEDLEFPAEDSLSLPLPHSLEIPKLREGPKIGILRYPHISNFLDFPTAWFGPGGGVRWVEAEHDIAGLNLLILPGTRRTRDDLGWMRERGLERAIREGHEHGMHIVGICGGYMILGERLIDPEGFEGPPGDTEGLGLLPVATRFQDPKIARQVCVLPLEGLPHATPTEELRGYEIRRGRTHRAPGTEAVFRFVEGSSAIEDGLDGAIAPDGQVWGTAIHGLLSQRGVWESTLRWAGFPGLPTRDAVHAGSGEVPAQPTPENYLERAIEMAANCVTQNMDLRRFSSLFHVPEGATGGDG